MRGDLLFYRATTGLMDRLIAHFTHGPYTHVAIDAGDGTIIEAQASGVRRVQMSSTNMGRVLAKTLHPASHVSESLAFNWIDAKIGSHYGWFDILDAVLHILHIGVYFGRPNEFDCSDLAACFAALYTNDPHLMGQVLDARQDISPNDLARYYHVL